MEHIWENFLSKVMVKGTNNMAASLSIWILKLMSLTGSVNICANTDTYICNQSCIAQFKKMSLNQCVPSGRLSHITTKLFFKSSKIKIKKIQGGEGNELMYSDYSTFC